MKDRIRQAAALFLIAGLSAACNDSELASASGGGDDPVAEIAAQSEYSPLDTAVFDGSGSYDPDGGDIVAWDWEMLEVPAGSASAVQLVTETQAEFFVDLAGDYRIRLTVTDDEGDTGSTTFEFHAVPSQSLHVQLTWDTLGDTDIDLHLINTGAGGSYQDDALDCYYSNCKPDSFLGDLDWGVANVVEDNPTLDIDNISSTEPENINIVNPADGSYQVAVHFFSNSADVSTSTWTIRIYLSGELAFEQVRPVAGDGSEGALWRVATIDWAAGQGSVTEINQMDPSVGFGF